MFNVIMTPGTFGLAALALRLLEREHVEVGSFMEPVTLVNLSEADADAAIDLLTERYKNVGETLTCEKKKVF